MDSIRYNAKEFNVVKQKAEAEGVDVELVLFDEAKAILEQKK